MKYKCISESALVTAGISLWITSALKDFGAYMVKVLIGMGGGYYILKHIRDNLINIDPKYWIYAIIVVGASGLANAIINAYYKHKELKLVEKNIYEYLERNAAVFHREYHITKSEAELINKRASQYVKQAVNVIDDKLRKKDKLKEGLFDFHIQSFRAGNDGEDGVVNDNPRVVSTNSVIDDIINSDPESKHQYDTAIKTIKDVEKFQKSIPGRFLDDQLFNDMVKNYGPHMALSYIGARAGKKMLKAKRKYDKLKSSRSRMDDRISQDIDLLKYSYDKKGNSPIHNVFLQYHLNNS